MLKKFTVATLMLFSSVAVSAALMSFNAVPAEAAGDGGVIVGPGGGGGGGYQAALIRAGNGKGGSTSNPSSAYKYFQKNGRYAPGNTVGIIRSADLAGCKKSQYIWFTGNTTEGANGKAALASTRMNQMLWRGQLGGTTANFDADLKKFYGISGGVSSFIRGNTAYACSYPYEKTTCGSTERRIVGNNLATFKSGRNTNSVVPGKNQSTGTIRNYCFIKCPVLDKKASTSDKDRWVISSKSGKFIPTGANRDKNNYAGNAARGNYCSDRADAKETRSLTAARSSGGGAQDDNGIGYEVSDPQPYAWTTEVLWGTENVTGDAAKDWDIQNKGGDEFNRNSKKTEWSKLTDSQVSDKFGSKDKGITPAERAAALAKDKATVHPSVALGEGNQSTLARGGVATAVETTKYIALNERKSKAFKCDYTYTKKWSFTLTLGGSYSMKTSDGDNRASRCPTSVLPTKITATNSNVNKYGNWNGIDTDVDVYATAGTDQVTSAWQTLSAHCNAEGYMAASPATADNGIGTNITRVNNGDTDKNWSGASVTATIKGDNAVNNLVWGNAGQAGSKKNTDKRGLFDKECGFNGVAVSNSGDEATSTHFRNNDFTLGKTSVDLFKPRNEGAADAPVVEYKDEPVLSTTAGRWILGTPYADGVKPANGKDGIGGAFRMANNADGAKNHQFFGTTNGDAAGQKNFSVDPYSSATSGLIEPNGENVGNEFYVASNWPSEAKAPQVLTFKYEYAPTVYNVIPRELGFDQNSNASSVNIRKGEAIQGKLYSKPGASASPAVDASIGFNLFAMQRNNTGSSLTDSSTTVPNRVDSAQLPFGSNLTNGEWNVEPRTQSPYYRVVKFVRATTE